MNGMPFAIEPLVLIPGMMADARLFAPQITEFARTRAITVALPIGGDRVEIIAERMLPQLPQRFALAGHGLGGVVAMEILRRAPDRVSRVCLMSTSPLPESPAQASEREPQIIGARTGRLLEAVKSLVCADWMAPSSKRVALAHDIVQMGVELGGDLFVAQSRAMQRRQDMQAALRRYKAPALVLCGEADQLNPLKRQRIMAELMPSSQIQVVPYASHMLPLENPHAVNQAMGDWLALPDPRQS